MFGFGKKVDMKVPDGKGGIKTVKVSQKQLDKWISSGAMSEVKICRAHVMDAMRENTIENWVVGKDIDKNIYDKAKDENGDIYVAIHYEEGEPITRVMEKELWDKMNSIMG